jgi:hypothetical protein
MAVDEALSGGFVVRLATTLCELVFEPRIKQRKTPDLCEISRDPAVER